MTSSKCGQTTESNVF